MGSYSGRFFLLVDSHHRLWFVEYTLAAGEEPLRARDGKYIISPRIKHDLLEDSRFIRFIDTAPIQTPIDV